MAKLWTDHFAFIAGAARYFDLAYFAVTGDDPNNDDHGLNYVISFDEQKWRYIQLNWHLAAMHIAVKPLQQMIAVGKLGNVAVWGSGDYHEEVIAPQEVIASKGHLTGVRTIGVSVYVVGMGRQAWRRDAEGNWADIGKGAVPSEKGVVGFMCVDGFTEQEVYGAGWDGAIWSFDGDSWTQRKNDATDAVLTQLVCAGNGVAYAAGTHGLLIQGRGDSWELVNHESMIDDIWSLAWYKDKLYLSSFYDVFTLEDGKLIRVDFGEDAPSTCYSLSVADGVLWSAGAKDVMSFDGVSWTRVDLTIIWAEQN